MAIGKSSIARAANTVKERKPAVSVPVISSPTTPSAPVAQIPLQALSFLPDDTRQTLAPSALLIRSIQQYGILEPLLVASLPDGMLILLTGHQRFSAAKHLKLNHLPAILHPVHDLAEAAALAVQVAPYTAGTPLHEEKFAVISSIHSDLPPHLL